MPCKDFILVLQSGSPGTSQEDHCLLLNLFILLLFTPGASVITEYPWEVRLQHTHQHWSFCLDAFIGVTFESTLVSSIHRVFMRRFCLYWFWVLVVLEDASLKCLPSSPPKWNLWDHPENTLQTGWKPI